LRRSLPEFNFRSAELAGPRVLQAVAGELQLVPRGRPLDRKSRRRRSHGSGFGFVVHRVLGANIYVRSYALAMSLAHRRIAGFIRPDGVIAERYGPFAAPSAAFSRRAMRTRDGGGIADPHMVARTHGNKLSAALMPSGASSISFERRRARRYSPNVPPSWANPVCCPSSSAVTASG